jgi:hypothetical protein
MTKPRDRQENLDFLVSPNVANVYFTSPELVQDWVFLLLPRFAKICNTRLSVGFLFYDYKYIISISRHTLM